MWAGMGGIIAVLDYLKQHGVKLTRDAVAYALQYNRQEAVRYLHSEGVHAGSGSWLIASRGYY
jgi:hypothetical protein